MSTRWMITACCLHTLSKSLRLFLLAFIVQHLCQVRFLLKRHLIVFLLVIVCSCIRTVVWCQHLVWTMFILCRLFISLFLTIPVYWNSICKVNSHWCALLLLLRLSIIARKTSGSILCSWANSFESSSTWTMMTNSINSRTTWTWVVRSSIGWVVRWVIWSIH